MENLSLEQQAIILKGIASQILQMNKPSFKIVEELFKEFDIDFEGNQTYTQMYKAIEASVYINDYLKQNQDLSQLTHKFAHYAFKHDTAIGIRNAVIDDLCK